MLKSGYPRLILLSVAGALVFGFASMLVLAWFSHWVSLKHRAEFMTFLATNAERALNEIPKDRFNPQSVEEAMRGSMRGFRPGGPGHGGPAEGKPPSRPPRPSLWIYSASGEMLFAEDKNPLPGDWDSFAKPARVHEVVSQDGFLHLGPETNLIKLDFDPAAYLVLRDDHRQALGPLFLTQAVITFATLFAALVFSLSITFLYLRRKSIEARAVLLRLEQGDLKARFEIKPFDEFGGLLLDFNRMAEAIERLVERVHATEGARKNLLQELGHDLRTPLTSLRTSFETAEGHFDQMSGEDRREVFRHMAAEVAYVRELIENLMTIASLHEPRFKTATEVFDLDDFLQGEIAQRRLATRGRIEWTLLSPKKIPLRADLHLIQRLFKNIFDNAARYAKSRVAISVQEEGGEVVVRIADDGPGLTPEALDAFGRRQEKRKRREEEGLHFSLGLGSVIAKAIAELHSGTVSIVNQQSLGALVTIRLPRLK